MKLVKLYRLILVDTVPGLYNGDKAVHTGTVRGNLRRTGAGRNLQEPGEGICPSKTEIP
jgi:hypothetical protein